MAGSSLAQPCWVLTPGIHSTHVALGDAHRLPPLRLLFFVVGQHLWCMQMSCKLLAGEGVE